jgi:benzodiazapine receptor
MNLTVMKGIDWPRLIGAIFLCQIVAISAAAVTFPAVGSWYASLTKPAFTPPPVTFSIVWPTLYVMMGIVFYRLLMGAHRPAIRLFLVQLLLNALWTPLFFGMHRPWLALADIGALWAVLAVCIGMFYRIDRLSAWLFVPYFLWVSFATVLNGSIALLNP